MENNGVTDPALVLTPIVRWAQRNDKIYLNVDLKNVRKDADIYLDTDTLRVKCFGRGARGENVYQFELNFFDGIDFEASSYEIKDLCINFMLMKLDKTCLYWSRLTEDTIKKQWLKIDFERWRNEDSEDSSLDTEGPDEDTLRNVQKERQRGQDDTTFIDNVKAFYLFMYNMMQFILYMITMCVLLLGVVMYGKGFYSDTYYAVGNTIQLAHLMMFLEIFNVILKLVPGALMPTVLQVLGRNFMLWGIIRQVPDTLKEDATVYYMLLTWSTIECVRYPFYMLSVVRKELKWLTWLRYTLWIPLYPIGQFLEGLYIIISLPYFDTSGRLSIYTDDGTCIFPFYLFLRFYLLTLIVGGFINLRHMYKQRSKKMRSSKRRVKSD